MKNNSDIKSYDPESDTNLREKDIYVMKYFLHALMPSHKTDYLEYRGPFDRDLKHTLNNIEEAAIEQGKKISASLKSGYYHVLNCILEQEIHSGGGDKIYYTLSIMGRRRQASNLYTILKEERVWPSLFKSDPQIKRYENICDLHTENFNSISELEEKLKLVATMEYVTKKDKTEGNWKWLEGNLKE